MSIKIYVDIHMRFKHADMMIKTNNDKNYYKEEIWSKYDDIFEAKGFVTELM